MIPEAKFFMMSCSAKPIVKPRMPSPARKAVTFKEALQGSDGAGHDNGPKGQLRQEYGSTPSRSSPSLKDAPKDIAQDAGEVQAGNKYCQRREQVGNALQ